MIVNKTFWNGKNVLITGHTGFKGSWLSLWLEFLGANVTGYSLEPNTERDNFVLTGLEKRTNHLIGDVRDFQKLLRVFEKYKPEFVFHLAAQPLVRQSYIYPKETYDVNIGGTVNILECVRLTNSVKVFINVTSDKCYENVEWIWGYRENDRLGGNDPYSNSKAGSELVTQAYRRSFFDDRHTRLEGKNVASVRAGNVIGGGDWQLDRLIPDCVRSLENRKPIDIRNPNSVRPWQYILEPLYGYLVLAFRMSEESGKFCEAWNFGPDLESTRPVSEIADLIIEKWGEGTWESKSDKEEPYESKILRLDIAKASNILEWSPIWDIGKAVSATVDWYKNSHTTDMYEYCISQIQSYSSDIC